MIQIPVEPQITNYLHRKASRNGIPLNGTFELTPCCNMDCQMCYVRMSQEKQHSIRPLRTAQEWLQLAETARDQGMLYLLLTGGEPFLRPDFREILTGLHRMGFIISINSNATLIDEETISWLRKTPPVRINITLYGASDETYNKLCRNPHGFTQTVNAIRLLREAGISVKINCSVTPWNAADLEAIYEYCNKENLVIQGTSYMFPPVRRNPEQFGMNNRFTPEDAAYYLAKIAQLSNGTEAYIHHMETEEKIIPPQIPGDECLDMNGEGIRCGAGRSSFWITWEGICLPCGMFPDEKALNVFEDGFEASWNRAKEISGSIRLPARCAACELKEECKACGAMAYTESGCFDKVPEYRCQMTQAYHGQCMRLLNELRGEKY